MDISLEVKQLLRNYTSLDSLVADTNIQYSTARRLYLGETKQIAPSHLLEIGSLVSKKRDIAGIIGFFTQGSKIREVLERAYKCLLPTENVEETNLSTNDHINSDIKYKLFLLAQNMTGTTRSFIEEEYGRHGTTALEELLEAEVFADFNGVILLSNQDDQLSVETTLKYSPSLLSFVKPENFSKATNIFTVHTNKVSKEARRKILKKLTQVHREINEISSNDSEKREIPIFTIVSCESMLSKEVER